MTNRHITHLQMTFVSDNLKLITTFTQNKSKYEDKRDIRKFKD
jgi:hypothetical protein